MSLSKLAQYIRAGEKNGKTPTAQILAKWANVPVQEAQEALDLHEASKRRAVEAVTIQKEAKLDRDMKPVLRVLSLVIAASCIIWSWGNVFSYFESSPWGALISTVTTAVLFVFPQTAKLSTRSFKWLQYGMFGLSIAFAMLTTVNANYNWRTQSVERSQKASDASSSAAYQSDQISSLKASQAQDEAERTTLTDKLSSYEPGSYEYNRLVNRIDKIKESVASARVKIEDLMAKKSATQAEARVAREDLFAWIQKATGIPSANLEFWMGIVPALLADVAGPVALRVALFL